jgi:hypothetical protein
LKVDNSAALSCFAPISAKAFVTPSRHTTAFQRHCFKKGTLPFSYSWKTARAGVDWVLEGHEVPLLCWPTLHANVMPYAELGGGFLQLHWAAQESQHFSIKVETHGSEANELIRKHSIPA